MLSTVGGIGAFVVLAGTLPFLPSPKHLNRELTSVDFLPWTYPVGCAHTQSEFRFNSPQGDCRSKKTPGQALTLEVSHCCSRGANFAKKFLHVLSSIAMIHLAASQHLDIVAT